MTTEFKICSHQLAIAIYVALRDRNDSDSRFLCLGVISMDLAIFFLEDFGHLF